MQGGVVQGIGWALNEEYVYDDDGRLRNASLLDYRMPTTLDVPNIETIIVEVPQPRSSLWRPWRGGSAHRAAARDDGQRDLRRNRRAHARLAHVAATHAGGAGCAGVTP